MKSHFFKKQSSRSFFLLHGSQPRHIGHDAAPLHGHSFFDKVLQKGGIWDFKVNWATHFANRDQEVGPGGDHD